jgi:hypothetical protein
MWKQRAVTLCGCLLTLPLLIGCTNGVGGPPQTYAPPASASASANPAGARVYAIGPEAPAAILVMLPGPGDIMTADPQLWTRQGFDVVTPTAPEIDRIAADQESAMTRLIAEAQAIANAPIWLVGPNPAMEAAVAALPPAGRGQVSGVVLTSTTSGAGSCSERMLYSYSGNGTAPKVSISRSGDACPGGSSVGAGGNATVAPSLPAMRPKAPRLIEASAPAAPASPAARQAAVRQVADLIKSAARG